MAGAPAIVSILEAQHALLHGDSERVFGALQIIAECIEKMIVLLNRMFERCDPAIFWKRIRPYSGGSKNSSTFPKGVFYEGVQEVFFALITRLTSS